MRTARWPQVFSAAVLAPLTIVPSVLAMNGVLRIFHGGETWLFAFAMGMVITQVCYATMVLAAPVYVFLTRRLPRVPFWAATAFGVLAAIGMAAYWGSDWDEVAGMVEIVGPLGAIVGTAFWLIAKPVASFNR